MKRSQRFGLRTMATAVLFGFLVLLVALASPTHAQLPELIVRFENDTMNTFFGQDIVPLGDQNGDGYSDILVTDGLRHQAWLYLGSESPDTVPALRFFDVIGRAGNLGDVNGDTYDDFALQGSAERGWKIGLYYGGPLLDTIRDMWFGTDTLLGSGYFHHTYDINANGTDDLITWGWSSKSLLLFEMGSAYDSIPDLRVWPYDNHYPNYSFGNGLVSGDFNGDGKTDIAAGFNPQHQTVNGSVYLFWGGAAFDSIPDMIINRPGAYASDQQWFGDVMGNIGDYNGDTFDDLYVAAHPSQDTTAFVYFGGTDIDTIPDIVIPEKAERVRAAGDLNHDGYDDFLTSYPLSFSSMGWITVYLGGPNADSLFDVRIRNSDIPLSQIYLGRDIAGIGDFNGDGIDDFAFSAQNGANKGEVYIYSGWDDGTAVDEEYQSNLPTSYSLSQNYPNPFNPVTTIEFTLPTRSNVTLTIHNVLGQQVATILSEELPAGVHRTQWDASSYPTGIYLYRLRAGEFAESKKMILLK